MKHENSLLRMELEKLGGGAKTDFFNPTAVGIQVAIVPQSLSSPSPPSNKLGVHERSSTRCFVRGCLWNPAQIGASLSPAAAVDRSRRSGGGGGGGGGGVRQSASAEGLQYAVNKA
jgi:hypothetical protein